MNNSKKAWLIFTCTLFAIIAMFFIVLSLCGVFDSNIKTFSNNYILDFSNNSNVCLTKIDSKNEKPITIIEPLIFSYCNNDKYIGLKQTEPVIEGKKPNYNKYKLYLIDTENTIIYGPFTSEETFTLTCNSVVDKTKPLSKWENLIT